MSYWSDLFSKENLITKLRHYTLPQLFYSFVALVGTYPFTKYIGYPVGRWIGDAIPYKWVSVLLLLIVVPVLVFTLFYFTLGKRTVQIFSFEHAKPGAKFCLAIVPIMFAFGGSALIYYHFDKMKECLLEVDNILQIKNHKDSTEAFYIKKFMVAYGYYYYTYDAHVSGRGSKGNSYSVTEVNTYIICPLLYDDYSVFQEDSHKYWVGFTYKKDLFPVVDPKGPEVLAVVQEHIDKLKEEDTIRYFEETDDYSPYHYLLDSRLDHDAVKVKQSVMLEAHFEKYKEYNGYSGLLWAFYVWVGSNLFTFIVIFFYDLKYQY